MHYVEKTASDQIIDHSTGDKNSNHDIVNTWLLF